MLPLYGPSEPQYTLFVSESPRLVTRAPGLCPSKEGVAGRGPSALMERWWSKVIHLRIGRNVGLRTVPNNVV